MGAAPCFKTKKEEDTGIDALISSRVSSKSNLKNEM